MRSQVAVTRVTCVRERDHASHLGNKLKRLLQFAELARECIPSPPVLLTAPGDRHHRAMGVRGPHLNQKFEF